VTPSWGDSGFKLEPKSREDRKPTWPRLAVLAGILVLAFVVAKGGCQDGAVDLTQDEAVDLAVEQIDFEPTYTQVRLLRQGLNRKAYWFVSLSQPIGFDGDRPDLFRELAVVQIDSTNSEVISVKEQSAEETKQMIAQAKARDQDELVQARLEEIAGEQ
jgi:hypothetical protein